MTFGNESKFQAELIEFRKLSLDAMNKEIDYDAKTKKQAIEFAIAFHMTVVDYNMKRKFVAGRSAA